MNKTLKLVLGFLVCACLLSLVYHFKTKSVPFTSLSSGPEKLKRAYDAMQVLVKDPFENLDAIEANKAEFQYLMSEVAAFEDSLGSLVRGEIAEGLKGARADVSGFTFFGTTKCSKDTYSDIKKTLPVNDLLRYGAEISILAGLQEDKLRPEYYARVVKFIDDGRCKSDSCDVLMKIYQHFRSQSLKSQEMINVQARKASDSLLPLWGNAEAVESNVSKLARTWPSCLGQINAGLFDYIRDDTTQLRAQYLLSEYRRLGATNSEALKQIKPVLTEGDMVKGYHVDGWDGEFAFRFEGDRLIAISGGPDTVIDSEDDIKIH